jgi:hypothetical protein
MSVGAGFLYCAILAAGASQAPQAPAAIPGDAVRVEISVPRTTLSIGDSVTVECAVTVPRGARTGEPFVKEPDPLLEMESRSVREETTASGSIRRYGILAYIVSADTAKIGPFAVRYVTAAGDSGEALSNTLVLPVAGFVEKPDAPPKPSRDPLGIASKGLPGWLYPLIAVILAALAGIALFVRATRRVAPPPHAPMKPVDELEEFERIRALRLGETGQVKELYARVSGAMRGFMHRNMGFDALYSTTEEIKRNLARASFDHMVKDSFREVFDESDMVKFAKYVPPDDLSTTIIDRAVVPVKGALAHIARERERLAEMQKPPYPESARTRGDPAGGER